MKPAIFCPNPIVWGDVATWISGIGSLIAVVVALWIARYSVREAKKRELEVANNTAQAMALAIHSELVPLAGAMKVLKAIRTHYAAEFTAENFDDLRNGSERIATPALDRFLERIDVFNPKVAGQLMIVYRGVLSIQDAMRTPQLDGSPMTDERAKLALKSVAMMAGQTEKWIYDSLDSLSGIARQAGFQVISTESVKAAVAQAAADDDADR